MFARLFTAHPATVGETYTEHMQVAWKFAFLMIGGGIACFVHGLVPGLFVTTGSNSIRKLHDIMVVNRNRHPIADDPLLASLAI